jgi:hypothetical protein
MIYARFFLVMNAWVYFNKKTWYGYQVFFWFTNLETEIEAKAEYELLLKNYWLHLS